MEKLIREISRNLYINSVHSTNPFIQEDSRFYVKVLAIKENWVMYQTCTGKVKYASEDVFCKTFTLPKHVSGKVCDDFNTYKDSKLLKEVFIESNPWLESHAEKSYYESDEFLNKFKC